MMNHNSKDRFTFLYIWLIAVALLLITWWHVFGLVDSNREKEIKAAERDLANITKLSQEHVIRTMRGVDQVVRFVSSGYLELGNKLNLVKLCAQGVVDTEIFPQLGIIDPRGIYILGNKPILGKVDLSDREHFKVHVATDTGELFISKPLLGRVSGKWSIQLTRRITNPNGEFAGVVVVSVDPGYFTRLYNSIDLGAQGVVSLYGLDGIARARIVGDKEEFGSNGIKSPMFDLIAHGQLEGKYYSVSVVDGVERLYYYRKIPGYKLIVADGIDVNSLFANHLRVAKSLYFQASVLSLLIVTLALALTGYLRNIRREMNKRQQAQAVAEDRSEQLNTIFALSPDGFISFDHSRCVKYANPAFYKLTGLTNTEVFGIGEKDFSELLAKVCSAELPFPGIPTLRALQNLGNGAAYAKRQLIQIDVIQSRVLEIFLRESTTETVSQILYFRDVTHESEVDRMKSEFLSTAAHELRTPMASIYGYSEVLLSHKFSENEQHEFLTTIFTQAKLMASIINELLDLARIEARQGKDFNMEQLDVQELIGEVATGFMCPEGRAAPVLQLQNAPLWIQADKKKMMQALINVISNAYKYSPGGGDVIVATLASDSVLTSRRTDSKLVGVKISDTGIGLTPEQSARVFERFYRADTSGQFSGTGLGMSIIKEIVEFHGGRVSLESQYGVGTSVTLWLKMHDPDQSINPHTTFDI